MKVTCFISVLILLETWGIFKMKTRLFSAVAIALVLVAVSPAVAKQQSGKVTGVFCAQGGDNGFIPASAFKPSVRAKLRRGQKATVNIAGFGPVKCTVY